MIEVSQEAKAGNVRGWYIVGICMLAYIFSFVDRQILALMIGPIEADLGISDTQFGLLHGFAFAIFYATMGIPLAALSDRVSRPAVITAGIAIWSAATVVCGFARSFGQLFIARVFVGAGEAALSPATYSLISDLFPKDKLGRAVAVYSLGSLFGTGLAFLAGGAVSALVGSTGAVSFMGMEIRAWQAVFIIVGAPGFLLALVMAATVRDPGRSGSGAAAPLIEVLRYIARERAIYAPHIIGYTLAAAALFAVLGWSPALLTRAYGLTPAQAGGWLGLLALTAGAGGILSSGWIMDALTRAGHAASPFTTGVIGSTGTLVFAACLPLASSLTSCLWLLGGLLYFASFPMPPSTAMMQIAAPPAMRARVSALFLCSNSLIGVTLGTLLVGLFNDRLFGAAAGGVIQSLALVAGAAGLMSAVILCLGCKPFARMHR